MLAELLKRNYSQILAFSRIIRYWQWQDKIQALTIAALMFLLLTDNLQLQIRNTFIFILYLYFPFSYGYLLNSLADKSIDEQVGKDFLGKNNRSIILSLLFVSGALTLLFPILFQNRSIMVFTMVMFLITSFYSLGPVRLKERGGFGLIIASFTQRSPFLFFLFLFPVHVRLVLYLFGWLLCLGFITETTHQLGDYYNDLKTGTGTYASKQGLPKTKMIIQVLRFILLIYVLIPSIIFFFTASLNYLLLFLLLFIFSHEAIRFTMSQMEMSKRIGQNTAQESARLFDGI